MNTGIHLKPESYMKWLLAIEKMNHGKTKHLYQAEKFQNMQMQIEMMKLKAQLYKPVVDQALETKSDLEKSYQEVLETIENEIGMSLDGCAIHEVTHEVIRLEEEKKS